MAVRPDRKPAAPLTAAQRVLLVAVSAAVVGINWFPNRAWRNAVRDLAGHPAYGGAWLVVEHALLYSTIPALSALLAWWLLARRQLMPPPRESFSLGAHPRRSLLAGLAGGLVVSVLVLGVIAASGAAPLHAPRFDSWSGLGNLFSNLWEEIWFSGFILLALVAATGRRWAGVVVTSLVFAAIHTQYPLGFKALIFVNVALMGSVRLWTGSLWTAWIAHQLSDLIIDALLM